LKESKYITNSTSADIKKLAKEGLANDDEGYRAEFVRLVDAVN
jgi:Ca-activated chloride channel family protein